MESVVARFYYYGARYYNPRESVWLSTDPLAELYPNVSPYAYALLNPVKLIDPTGMAPESIDGIETKYKNKNTGEVVEVHDGKDVTVEVNDSEFAYAKVYESQLNMHIDGESYPALYLDESYDNIIDKYETFYYETRYGDRLTRYQDSDYWLDSGPKFNRSKVRGGAGGLEFITGGAGKSVVKMTSLVKNDAKLFEIAKDMFSSNKALSKEANGLIKQAALGNFKSGKGAKDIGNGIFELRGESQGARVYYRIKEGVMEVLGYSNKNNQQQVINRVKKLYGK